MEHRSTHVFDFQKTTRTDPILIVPYDDGNFGLVSCVLPGGTTEVRLRFRPDQLINLIAAATTALARKPS